MSQIHIISESEAIAQAMALALMSKRKPKPLTPEQEVQRQKAEEIAAWNREVEARRRAKKLAKVRRPSSDAGETR